MISFAVRLKVVIGCICLTVIGSRYQVVKSRASSEISADDLTDNFLRAVALGIVSGVISLGWLVAVIRVASW